MGFRDLTPGQESVPRTKDEYDASNPPPFHIRFHFQQVLESDSPWTSRCRLEHEPSEFGVEMGRFLAIAVSRKLISIVSGDRLLLAVILLAIAGPGFPQGLVSSQRLQNFGLS